MEQIAPGCTPIITPLGEQITELVAHLDAAQYQLMVLLEEFDRNEDWGDQGIRSCAHWLNVHCGMSTCAARERVRVAHALPELPLISKAFSEGQVSYSKVRAMTRVAKAENEDLLLNTALHGTASQLEKQVRYYRRYKRLTKLADDNLGFSQRKVNLFMNEDDTWIIRGRLTAEQGALLKKALELGMDQLFQEQKDVPDEVDAREQRSHPLDKPFSDTFEARRSDALARMACDASVLHWLDTHDGEPLNIGRKSRTIPPAIRRALHRRDQGCRFPGCTCTRFVDAHHIHHWVDGGETKMDNLVLLCRRHHRLVHEEGYSIKTDAEGDLAFTLPDGRPLHDSYHESFRGNSDELKARNEQNGLEITSFTAIPHFHGVRMDHHMALGGLVQRE